MASDEISRLMDDASVALVGMDYLTCEALCEQALVLARDRGDWATYGRILLPLQESRRQRRMIAAEGVIRLGTGALTGPPVSWLEDLGRAGCIVLSHPWTALDAAALAQEARRRRRYIEVLWCAGESARPRWHLTTFAGLSVGCQLPAPPESWREHWLPGHLQAANWFIGATERLGDEALEGLDAVESEASESGWLNRITHLESALAAVTDHELLHQELARTARSLCGAASESSA